MWCRQTSRHHRCLPRQGVPTPKVTFGDCPFDTVVAYEKLGWSTITVAFNTHNGLGFTGDMQTGGTGTGTCTRASGGTVTNVFVSLLHDGRRNVTVAVAVRVPALYTPTLTRTD